MDRADADEVPQGGDHGEVAIGHRQAEAEAQPGRAVRPAADAPA